MCWQITSLKYDMSPPLFSGRACQTPQSDDISERGGGRRSLVGSGWIIFLNTYDVSSVHTDIPPFNQTALSWFGADAYVGIKSRAAPQCKHDLDKQCMLISNMTARINAGNARTYKCSNSILNMASGLKCYVWCVATILFYMFHFQFHVGKTLCLCSS